MYSSLFKEAVLRSKKLGLFLPAIKLKPSKEHIDKSFLEDGLGQLMLDTFGPLSINDISAGCVRMHVNLLDAVKEHFNCNAYLTIGSVWNGEHPYYDFNEEKINDTLQNGISSSFPFHCWITLDSMEIIDVTFSTTYGVVNKNENMIGQSLAIHPNNLKSSGIKLVYEPKLVGDDYLKLVGFDLESGVALGFTSTYVKPSWFYRNIKLPISHLIRKT